MTLQEQMIAANVRNWLSDLAIGAKATATTIRFAVCKEEEAYVHEASVYDDGIRDDIPTVHVHRLKELAKAAELDVQYRTFTKDDYYYEPFSGEYFLVFNGVKFSDMRLRKGYKYNEGK